MSEQTYQVCLRVTVEPETDLDHFQPGSWCATLVGTDWSWVDGTPLDAARELVEHVLSGFYRDQPGLPEYIIEEKSDGEDALATLQAALRTMLFSRRQFCYSELQRRVSVASRFYDEGLLMAWPDVLSRLTPEIIRDSIQAARDATPAEISARLSGRHP